MSVLVPLVHDLCELSFLSTIPVGRRETHSNFVLLSCAASASAMATKTVEGCGDESRYRVETLGL